MQIRSRAVVSGRLSLAAVLIYVWFATGFVRSDEPARIALHRGTVVEFAQVKKATQILTRRDEFIRAMSPFDRQVRLKTVDKVTDADYGAFVRKHIRPWEKSEIEKLSKVFELLRPKMARFKIPFPKTVLLVKTTGDEEGGAAYCRSNAIVLPQRMVDRPAEKLTGLLAHELFHIVSRQNPNLRPKFYAIVGFKPCGHVELPAGLRERKITNPDAPLVNQRIRLKINNRQVDAVPLLFSRHEKYDPKRGGNLFSYMRFRLLVVQKRGKSYEAVVVDGKPELLVPAKTQSFHEQIGKNTGYIIHPEEIIADNFKQIIQGSKNPPTPRIHRELETLFQP